jgi:alpha/beta superfamily hydrolase
MKAVQIQSGELVLEGAVYTPESGDALSIVVVCHPHPLRGGDMHNNVVMTIADALVAEGIAALTFNFRGAGRSQGAHDNGVGEQDDARAAIAFAGGLEGVERVGLAGYSFGAGVAASIADATVKAVALISPPAARLADGAAVLAYGGPLLLMAGDRDHIVSAEAMEAAAGARQAPTDVVPVAGVDHFWWGAEQILGETVASFFRRNLASSK